MKFIALKLSDGKNKGKLSFYCRVLKVSRQGFYEYLKRRNKPWKYEQLAKLMYEILAEDIFNDSYGRHRMYDALKFKKETENLDIKIPSKCTVYRIMKKLGIARKKKHKPNGITKADKMARKSDDLLKRDFRADAPFQKCVTDITEIPAKDGKLYVSAIFDCFDASVLGLCMRDNMKAGLCVQTVINVYESYPEIKGAIIHSDRGSQYTSEEYRAIMGKYGIIQSMNSDGGRCHDNARCESMWARMKEELLYDRYNTKLMSIDEIKTLIWRYFMSYWNNRRICSANGGIPPIAKRNRYFYSFNSLT